MPYETAALSAAARLSLTATDASVQRRHAVGHHCLDRLRRAAPVGRLAHDRALLFVLGWSRDMQISGEVDLY